MSAFGVIVSLAGQSLLNRRATVLLTMISIAVSVALLSGVQRIRSEARASFGNTISDTDLIVGARAAPIQLLLYSVFRMGDPTQNMTWESYERISRSPDTAWSIPLSLGDSHRGFRVVGTTRAYLDHYRFGGDRRLALTAGRWFDHPDQVVLGAAVAQQLGYATGTSLTLSHGIGSASFSHHGGYPLAVSGVLAATGTPVDQALHVSLETIDRLHEATPAGAPHDDDHASHEPESITAFFLGLKTPTATLRLQRAINTYQQEALTAVIPGVALQQLWSLVRVAERALLAVSAGVIVAGLFGMLSAMLTSLNERRREMAILRAAGARPWHVVALLTAESGLVALVASVLGIVLVYALTGAFSNLLFSQFSLQFQQRLPGTFDLLVVVGVTLLAMALSLWPALRAYRTTLYDGLTTRL